MEIIAEVKKRLMRSINHIKVLKIWILKIYFITIKYIFSGVHILIFKIYLKIELAMRDIFSKYVMVLTIIGAFLALPAGLIIWILHEKDNQISSVDSFSKIILYTSVFCIYTLYLYKILKNGRLRNSYNSNNMKYIYLVFAFFYFAMDIANFAKEVLLKYIETNKPLFDYIQVIGLDYNYFTHILWGGLNSVKEAILTAIIFDAAFQMANYRVEITRENYIRELIKYERFYILRGDRNSKKPRIWLLRPDDCADIVDELKSYGLYSDYNFDLDISDEDKKFILNQRRKIDNLNTDNYFYIFRLLKFDKSNSEKWENNMIKLIKDNALVLPRGVKVKDDIIKSKLIKIISWSEQRLAYYKQLS